jgi:hypothetical protein
LKIPQIRRWCSCAEVAAVAAAAVAAAEVAGFVAAVGAVVAAGSPAAVVAVGSRAAVAAAVTPEVAAAVTPEVAAAVTPAVVAPGEVLGPVCPGATGRTSTPVTGTPVSTAMSPSVVVATGAAITAGQAGAVLPPVSRWVR